MGHRHLFNQSYTLETENDQNWSLAQNTHIHNARNGAGESSSLTYPADNMSIDGPLDLSMHTYIAPEDYRNQASSSNYNGKNPFNEEDLFDIRVGNGRIQYKRKSPGIPDGSGTSSDVTMLTEPWQETPWDYHTTNPNGMSIDWESQSSVRNVRSRSMFDLETDPAMTNLANNLPCEYYTTSPPMDVSPSVNFLGHSSNGQNPPRMSSTAHDSSFLSYELNPFLERDSNATRSNHDLQYFQNNLVQSAVRGVRSGSSQRSAFRVSSSNMRLGNTDEGLQLATNSYSSRNLRPSSTRSRMSNERYRSFSGLNFHDRPLPEGLVIMDRTAFHGSRNPFDQHRDMRLDVDDMSYEELLALGERIGSVETGLPEHLFSKCVQESIYCSSDQIQDEVTCVICLEEYANMDDIGTLRVCGHDFHVGCVKKWLSMKNQCPICKAEPMKQK